MRRFKSQTPAVLKGVSGLVWWYRESAADRIDPSVLSSRCPISVDDGRACCFFEVEERVRGGVEAEQSC